MFEQNKNNINLLILICSSIIFLFKWYLSFNNFAEDISTKIIFESISDGTLISITSDGTLAQHFGDTKNENDEISFGFTLSSDTLQEPNRFMGTLISNVNNNLPIFKI